MVLDFHTHAFPDRIAASTIHTLAQMSHGLCPQTDGTVAGLVTRMDDWGVDKAVLLNIATAPKQHRSILAACKQVQEEYPDRLISFSSVHPEAPDALEYLQAAYEAGIKGIKFHPGYQRTRIDDPIWDPLYQFCSDHGLITVYHAGFDPCSPELMHAPPEACARVNDRFPKMKMVLAHMGSALNWEATYEQLAGRDLYFDTAIAPEFLDPELCRKIIERHGADRILFASDCPWGDASLGIRYIKEMGLGEEAEEKIFHLNAERLLGI